MWPDLPEAHARVAAQLRVLVLNWNPLGWMGVPFEAHATATGDGDGFELVLYAPLPDLMAAADAADLLSELCRSVVEAGVGQELLLTSGAYAQLAYAGKAPGLLAAIGTLPAIEPPQLAPSPAGWEPIGLGAIQDLVQSQFGPVDLDRSKVAFDPGPRSRADCPACAGRRFGFPAELADAQSLMCPDHAAQASEIIAERLARAKASNPAGRHAITDASAALGAPTHGLPLELIARLDAIIECPLDEDTTREDLRAQAVAALELADLLRDRPSDFEDWVEASMADEWMSGLPWDLARHDLLDDAVRVADALAALDRDSRSFYANDAAVLLADAQHADEARARVVANLHEFPGDLWTRVHAGDVHERLGDLDRAEQDFRRAAKMTGARGDRFEVATVAQRIANLLARCPRPRGRGGGGRTAGPRGRARRAHHTEGRPQRAVPVRQRSQVQ